MAGRQGQVEPAAGAQWRGPQRCCPERRTGQRRRGAQRQPAPSGAAPSGAAPSGPAPSGGAEGATVKISAKGIAYQESAISAAAGQPFKIEFENEDAGTPHNVAIHQGPASGTEVFKGEIFPGVATKIYDVPALTAGSYTFACTVHPTMTGTLTVQ